MSVTILQSYTRPLSRGFTMIEVLVALVVLSVGLLGLAGMQLTGLRYNYGAFARSQASLMAYDLIDRMRANNDPISGFPAGAYPATINTLTDSTAAQACVSSAAGCTPAQFALEDVFEWCQLFNAAPQLLPGASAIMNNVAGVVTITVSWQERSGNTAGPGTTNQTLTISVTP